MGRAVRVEHGSGRVRLTDARDPARADLHRAEVGAAPSPTLVERRSEHVPRALGQEEQRQPPVRELCCHLDVALAERGDVDRDPGTARVGDDLQGLAETGAHARWERHVVGVSIVVQWCIPRPDHATDLDDLTSPHHRPVVLHAMEALDHLRAGRSEAEHATPAGELVETRRGHREEGRCTGIDGQDSGSEPDRLGASREVAQQAHRVEAVCLGDPHEVEARGLEIADTLYRALGVAVVGQRHREAHR